MAASCATSIYRDPLQGYYAVLQKYEFVRDEEHLAFKSLTFTLCESIPITFTFVNHKPANQLVT